MPNAHTPHAYRKTQILTSRPGELMLMLYNAAICYGEQARGHLEENAFDEAHAMLVKTENIVLELSSGLRRNVHPELVENLSRLFEFVFYRLFEGNISHNPRCIDEAVNVLSVLRDAWTGAVERANDTSEVSGAVGDGGSVELSA